MDLKLIPSVLGWREIQDQFVHKRVPYRLNVFKGYPTLGEEALVGVVKESDQYLADGLLSTVSHQVFEDLSVGINIVVDLFRLVADQLTKNLAEIAAQHIVRLLISLYEGEQLLKKLEFVR